MRERFPHEGLHFIVVLLPYVFCTCTYILYKGVSGDYDNDNGSSGDNYSSDNDGNISGSGLIFSMSKKTGYALCNK